MGPETDNVANLYTSLLANHLEGTHEAVLLNAHELGRKALTAGFGVLDLVNVHHVALRTLSTGRDVVKAEKAFDLAADFFAEILSPFEMMLRGYRETNTDLLRTNKALREATEATEFANRELEAFSYSVAHDLRAPLRSIDGFSLALLEDCGEKLDDGARQHLQYVRESAQHMARLIDDLLALSRITRDELDRTQIDLGCVARDVVGRLMKAPPDRQIDVAIGDDLIATCDARLMTVVFDNLIGNAWKFTGKCTNPHIEVGAADTRPRTYFVRDNGAGFDMNYASKLFGVFQRLHSVVEFEGTGIGLATVQRIIRKHGGRVWADGAVGRGATFYFTLESAPDGPVAIAPSVAVRSFDAGKEAITR
jgi:signal transduction histidine kinase